MTKTEHNPIVVTGATRGIGAAIARQLLESGHKVIGLYKTSDDEAAKIANEFPYFTPLKIDLSNRDDLLRGVEILSEFKIGGLVNNAGIIEFETFEDFDIGIWDLTFAVNVTAPLLLATRLAASFADGASIVNVASTDGMIGSFASVSYASSKAALLNLTKSLANNLGPKGIRVNAVAPGWINTGMSTAASMAAGGLTPLGRNGTPNEVAEVVAFLLSKNAAFVTGSCVVVDGGYTNVDSIMKREAAGEI
jgi:NAD(P)-dependent dehydrogenase (short-subunit alcohol dehydrogenase family)